MKTVQTIVALIVIIGSTIIGAYLFIDDRYALAEDVKNVKARLEYKILSDQIDNIQQRIWKIEDRYHDVHISIEAADELRDLKYRKERIEKEMKLLELKGGK